MLVCWSSQLRHQRTRQTGCATVAPCLTSWLECHAGTTSQACISHRNLDYYDSCILNQLWESVSHYMKTPIENGGLPVWHFYGAVSKKKIKISKG